MRIVIQQILQYCTQEPSLEQMKGRIFFSVTKRMCCQRMLWKETQKRMRQTCTKLIQAPGEPITNNNHSAMFWALGVEAGHELQKVTNLCALLLSAIPYYHSFC